MKLALRLKLVLILTALLTACFSTHRNFTAFRERPAVDGSANVKFNGVYFIRPYVRKCSTPISFYVYPDGSLILVNGGGHSDVPDSLFWENPDAYFKALRLPKFGDPGHYVVRDSVITFQFFSVFPGYFFDEDTIELQGKIQNDSTIILTGGSCKRCSQDIYYCFNKDGQLSHQYKYQFYKTDVQPDTAVLWFRGKRWYNKNVWHHGNPQGN